MNRLAVFFLLPVWIILGSCHWFAREEVDFEFHFNESMVTVQVGMIGALYLTVNPSSYLQDYRLTYTMDEAGVATIQEYSKSSVVFKGNQKGSAVITAELAGKRTQAVITVTE
jgi:molybdenum cofactor biosynthesis enzyme